MDKADFNATTITTLMDGNHATFADTVAHVSVEQRQQRQ